MKKSEFLDMIKEEVEAAFEAAAAPVGHPSNWHGTPESQRQWVMNLAAKDALGLISLSRIADALGVPRQSIHNTYARLIRHYADRNDFRTIIPGVPFQSEQVYQLIGSPTLTDAQIQQAEAEEERLFKKTQGVYYQIRVHPSINASMPLLCWLNLAKGENPKPYFDMIPDKSAYYLSQKPVEKGPKDTDKIVGKLDWEDFVKTQLTENRNG